MSNMASDAKACFSSKVEYRAVIRYLYLKGKTGKEIHGELADVYGSSAPSYAQVKFWVGDFKRSRTSLEDEARSGRPLDVTDEEMCKKVWDLVYSDRRIQVDEIAQALGISHGSVSTVLHDLLTMRKLTARWVRKPLSDEQMATRASVCSKTQPSAGKVMATVFWDTKGVIMLDFLPKRSTITGVYYANLLDQLRTAIREKRRCKLSKGVLLQQDNASTLAKLQWML